MMVSNEIDNFIEVYNNSVIELVQCFVTSFFGRIDHLASSVIKFRPKISVPKHCIRSITYNYMFKNIEDALKWELVVLGDFNFVEDPDIDITDSAWRENIGQNNGRSNY